MPAYITSMGVVSPQKSSDDKNWLEENVTYDSPKIRCIEPDYKELISPIHLRKMPRILKIGLYASMLCMRNSGIINPDAIIVGTGFGCLEDLEKFISQISSGNEKTLFTTSFIHSTHNLVGSQIAMMTKNQNYNMNYVHRSFSFENALTDAIMLLEENEANNVLTGCIDEITDYHFKLYQYLNFWKINGIADKNFYLLNTPGTIAGEGSAFFNLASVKTIDSPEIKGVYTFYKPENPTEIKNHFYTFLDSIRISVNDIDLVISGNTGDNKFDKVYETFAEDCFSSKKALVFYKHLCGEYHTATGFALSVAVHILKNQKIPSALVLSNISDKDIRHILIYNHYRNIEHAFILLSKG